MGNPIQQKLVFNGAHDTYKTLNIQLKYIVKYIKDTIVISVKLDKYYMIESA